MLEHTPLSGDVVHFSLTYFRPNKATLVELLLVPKKVAHLLTQAAAPCSAGAAPLVRAGEGGPAHREVDRARRRLQTSSSKKTT